MKATLDINLAETYTSQSQKIRVITESWVKDNMFCPHCGFPRIEGHKNNKPVADFFCLKCREDYELKSKVGSVGSKIVDGAYSTMIQRLTETNNPNFFFLTYSKKDYQIKDFLIVPKHFFTPDIIEKRKPLASTAERAGWVGCNINLKKLPESGKIFFIRNGAVTSKGEVVAHWQKTVFLRDAVSLQSRGWLLDTIKCIEKLRKTEFTLDDLYKFEQELFLLYPENKHIKDKLRQQLQLLRDRGFLDFIGRGKYRLN